MKTKTTAKLILITAKVAAEDLALIQRKADRFTEGNLSAWLRYAGKQYSPKKGERIPIRASKAR